MKVMLSKDGYGDPIETAAMVKALASEKSGNQEEKQCQDLRLLLKLLANNTDLETLEQATTALESSFAKQQIEEVIISKQAEEEALKKRKAREHSLGIDMFLSQ